MYRKLSPNTFHPMTTPFELFIKDTPSSFENYCPDCQKRNTSLNLDRSLLILLFLSCAMLQMLGMFFPMDGYIVNYILKGLCLACVEIESIKDRIIDISNCRSREQLKGSGMRLRKCESVTR